MKLGSLDGEKKAEHNSIGFMKIFKSSTMQGTFLKKRHRVYISLRPKVLNSVHQFSSRLALLKYSARRDKYIERCCPLPLDILYSAIRSFFTFHVVIWLIVTVVSGFLTGGTTRCVPVSAQSYQPSWLPELDTSVISTRLGAATTGGHGKDTSQVEYNNDSCLIHNSRTLLSSWPYCFECDPPLMKHC